MASTYRGTNSYRDAHRRRSPHEPSVWGQAVVLDSLPLREEFRGRAAYGAPQLDLDVRLNTNENPYPPTADLIVDLVSEVNKIASGLNRYPDRDCRVLRRELARYVSAYTGVEVTEHNIWAANGSNEVLQELLQAFGGPGRRALGFTPSYSMHPILSAGTCTQFVDCPRREENGFAIDVDSAVDTIKKHRPSVVFVTTPNNPTGGVTPLDDIRVLLDAVSDPHVDGIVIVDEAYGEFDDGPSACELLADYPGRLVVSRTMSKAFDFAGGRLGYFVAAPAFVEAVMLVRLPYHLSALAQAAATVALRYSADTLASVDKIVIERGRVQNALLDLGFHVVPSKSNFLFFAVLPEECAETGRKDISSGCRVGHDDRRDAGGSATLSRRDLTRVAWREFLDRGVLIRDVGVDGYLRVTIGLPTENDRFLEAAREYAIDHGVLQ
ncbi:histidinol-phosphate transaminase [Corynebacterium kroppenstedtii]|uniref:histidinol-phosphate transaminase n=1 Tax=Corynebacterium sp. PCR 32 TaxID=3351342 RepID=UPI0030ABF113